MGHSGSRAGGGGGGGGRLVTRGGELSEVDLPATGLLGLGLLLDCDGFSGVIDLCCGVIGGFLTKGVSSDSDSSGLNGV